ncbi:hypothetical protein STRDD10_01194 [Streptococcus sp. DD10]|nr:hypothetical protein [Streptococcus sp. DD10]KXT74126.1 hypothetical protein STRDD10_01194 [Streptococcus sp. DD10]
MKNEKSEEKYIREQAKDNITLDKLILKEYEDPFLRFVYDL